ncbi:hypothetical protein C9993_09130, partial [Marinobacter sp. Z-F4-2]
VESLDDFRNVNEGLNVPVVVSFLLGRNLYTVDELYRVLVDPGSNEKLHNERAQISEHQIELRDQFNKLEQELNSMKDPTRFTWMDQLVGNVVKLGWPFLLISLLGLKLARGD